MTKSLFELVDLKERGVKPRVHPNGFIQLDLSPERRLHVWHPCLTYRQKTFSPVHNHIFAFNSVIYVGRMVNVMYEFDDSRQTHEEWRVRLIEGEETKLVNVGNGPVGLVPIGMQVIQAGMSYDMPQWMFHETLTNEPTLTIITKKGSDLTNGPNSRGASVMVPVGEEPDNGFRRADVDVDVLWTLIHETMRRGGYCI